DELPQRGHQLGKIAQSRGCLALDEWNPVDLAGGRQQAHFARLGVLTQVFHGHFADAARRLVDDSIERDAIARIQEQPQVSQNISVFLALIERQAAHDLVRYPLTHERLFQSKRQGVDAEEDSEIAIASLARLNSAPDL